MKKLIPVVFITVGLCLSVPTISMAVEISGIEIIDYGIYRAIGSDKAIEDEEAAVFKIETVKDIELIEQTERIPASVGTIFGCRFVINGKPNDGNVNFTVKLSNPGIRIPGMAPSHGLREQRVYKIGKTGWYLFSFDYIWEAVPGEWAIQILYKGRTLAENKFTVYKP